MSANSAVRENMEYDVAATDDVQSTTHRRDCHCCRRTSRRRSAAECHRLCLIIFILVLVVMATVVTVTLIYSGVFNQAVDAEECRQFGFTRTHFPNLVGESAAEAARSWWELLYIAEGVHCSEQLTLFGCSVIYPMYTDDDVIVKPCRAFCQSVLRDCAFFLKLVNLHLLATFNCLLLPDSGDNCVSPDHPDIRGHVTTRNHGNDGRRCDKTSDFQCATTAVTDRRQNVSVEQGGRCVSRQWVCDGVTDCPLDDDELRCPTCDSTRGDQFRCKSGSCVDVVSVCDGVVDCLHADDEADCLRLYDVKSLSESGNVVEGELRFNHSSSARPVCLEQPVVLADSWLHHHVCMLIETSWSWSWWFTAPSEVRLYYTRQFALIQNRSDCLHFRPTRITCNFTGCVEPSKTRSMLLLSAAEADKQMRKGESVSASDDWLMEAGDWPWLVSLHGGPKRNFFCGATLITDDWLLTAAHCASGLTSSDEWQIVGGRMRRTSSFVSRDQQVRQLSDVIVHPGFSAKDLQNDIALLRLDRPFRHNARLRPICLLPVSMTSSGSPQRSKDPIRGRCYVVGWGKRSRYHKSYGHQARLRALRVYSRTECSRYFYNENIIDIGPVFCTTSEPSGVDVCRGDSGSSVICESELRNDESLQLAGVVSYGSGNVCGNPTVHTDVTSFLPWIRNVIDSRR